jgi:hypothetical protein
MSDTRARTILALLLVALVCVLAPSLASADPLDIRPDPILSTIGPDEPVPLVTPNADGTLPGQGYDPTPATPSATPSPTPYVYPRTVPPGTPPGTRMALSSQSAVPGVYIITTSDPNVVIIDSGPSTGRHINLVGRRHTAQVLRVFFVLGRVLDGKSTIDGIAGGAVEGNPIMAAVLGVVHGPYFVAAETVFGLFAARRMAKTYGDNPGPQIFSAGASMAPPAWNLHETGHL